MSAKADYAIRALVEIAARQPSDGSPRPVKGDVIASAQDIPMKFCENILSELRGAGIVASRRGREGGYWPAIPAAEIRLGDVIRVVEGPLAAVRGERPSDVEFTGTSAALQAVWVATRAALRRVLDTVTIADVVSGELPPVVAELLRDDGAWAAVRIPG